MANAEHLEMLRKGVPEFNRWRIAHNTVDLRGVDLSSANLEAADLFCADLRRANLSEANLRYSNLRGANLGGAKLRGTDFNHANLRNADLSRTICTIDSGSGRHTDFADTDLSFTILKNANLRQASFYGAVLFGADLTSANMSGAILGRSDLADLDLRSVKGLDAVRHAGPSSIGVDTLIRSHGNIPEVFLRGCGTPELFIAYAKSLVANPAEYYSVFVSYSHADKIFARRLHDRLQERGILCWLDERQLLPGDSLHDHVDRGIRLWDKFLLCCSKDSLKPSSWVDKEILTALEKEDGLTRQRELVPKAETNS